MSLRIDRRWDVSSTRIVWGRGVKERREVSFDRAATLDWRHILSVESGSDVVREASTASKESVLHEGRCGISDEASVLLPEAGGPTRHMTRGRVDMEDRSSRNRGFSIRIG